MKQYPFAGVVQFELSNNRHPEPILEQFVLYKLLVYEYPPPPQSDVYVPEESV